MECGRFGSTLSSITVLTLLDQSSFGLSRPEDFYRIDGEIQGFLGK